MFAHILISLMVGFCVAFWVAHISWHANARMNLFYEGEPTWSLVWVSFIGAAAFTYGVIAL